jgi:arginase
MKNLKIIEVKSELGAGTRGASLGSEALKLASLEHGDSLFGKVKSREIRDSSRLLFQHPQRVHAKRIKGVVKVFERLAKAVQSEIQRGHIPIILSGDHSSAGGGIAGLKAVFPNERIGVVWIDAHADLHSPYTTPSGNIHGMPLATALAIDHLEMTQNNLDSDDTIPHWEKLKNLGNICPKLLPEDLVFIGLRDLEPAESSYIRQHQILKITPAVLRRSGIKNAIEKALLHLQHCSALYVSFDVDSLDARLVPGTGTPVKDGLTVDEAKKILTQVLKDPRVRCFELTELNPLLDSQNQTAYRVFPIFKKAVETLAKKQKKQKVKLNPGGTAPKTSLL